ncbi:MAG TPA: hypothetical protein VFE72_08895 [Lysobacter sp.]|nr:hypothetical protein [Lysobacter sp.]
MPLPAVLILAAATATSPDATALHGAWMMCDRGLQYMEQTDPRGDPNMRLLFTAGGEARLAWPDPAQNPADADRSGRYTYRDGRLVITIGGRSLELSVREDEAGTLVGTASTGLETRLCPLGQDPASLDRPVPAYSLTAVITREGEIPDRVGRWSPPATPPPAGIDGVWEVVRIVTSRRSEMPPYGYPTRKIVLDGDGLCVLDAEDTRVDPERCMSVEEFVDEGRLPTRTALGELMLVRGGGETYLRWIGPVRAEVPAVRTRVVLLDRRDDR